MSNIAFIGLGNMGSGMCANLAKAGHQVHAFDLNTKALKTRFTPAHWPRPALPNACGMQNLSSLCYPLVSTYTPFTLMTMACWPMPITVPCLLTVQPLPLMRREAPQHKPSKDNSKHWTPCLRRRGCRQRRHADLYGRRRAKQPSSRQHRFCKPWVKTYFTRGPRATGKRPKPPTTCCWASP